MARATKLNLNWTDKRTVIGLSALVMVAYLTLAWFIDQKRIPITYYVSQWMVTFAAGFVRRGLLGQTIFDLSRLTKLPPIELIKCCHYSLATALASIVTFQCVKNRQWLGLAGLCVILSNGYLTKYIWMETGSIDVFFILLPIFNLWLARSHPERYVPTATLFFATAGLFVALSHEAFLFLSLPLNLVISWRQLQATGKQRAIVAMYAIPVAACAIESFFHGTVAQSAVMEQCWQTLGVSVPKRTALYYMGFSLPQEFKFVYAVLSPVTVAVWIFDILLCFAPFYFLAKAILSGVPEETKARFKLKCRDYLWWPLAATLPMYAVGSDWDRWPAIPIVAGSICLLMVANDEFSFQSAPKMNIGWVCLAAVGLIFRPVPPNVYLNNIEEGPLVIAARLILRMPV